MTIRMGINLKMKNSFVVLHFHKIQVRLNISRICTPKIREWGISRKHLVLQQKKKKNKNEKEKEEDMQQPLGFMNLVYLRRLNMRSPQRTGSQ